MVYAVGIDLGTTNSVISLVRRGQIETISVDGRSTMPSVVGFRDNGTVLVGQSAKARMMVDPENTIASSKRFIGDPRKNYNVSGRSLSPTNVATYVLQRLMEAARAEMKTEIWDAVITIPAYFNEAQREATRRAGEEAGLNVLRLVPEPTAAAIAYGLDKGRDQTIMVYDFGGGTFDVSILAIRGNNFDVLAVGGDTHLGGDDLDQEVMRWAANRFAQETGIRDLMNSDSRDRNILQARQRLKEAAETAKIELAQARSATINLPDLMGHTFSAELSRDEYNFLISPLIDRSIVCVHSTLQDARLRPDDIDRLIMVGGSTKNVLVRERLTAAIKEPYVSERVDEAVAHGAAIVAASLFTPEALSNVPEVTDKTAHSLGIDVQDAESNKLNFLPIIPRQTTYPVRRGFLGFAAPGQDKVIMSVLRGESPRPEENTPLGDLELPVIPPGREWIAIGAVFELDSDGILHFTAIQFPPVSRVPRSLLDYGSENGGALDLAQADALVAAGGLPTLRIQLSKAL